MKIKVLAASVALLLCSAPCWSATGNSFVNLEVGKASLEVDGAEFDLDDATGFALNVGYFFTDNIAIEAGYLMANGFEYSESYLDQHAKMEIDTTSIKIGFLGKYYLDSAEKFSLLARAGYQMWDADMAMSVSLRYEAGAEGAESYSESDSDDGSDLYYGIGAGYKLTDQIEASLNYTVYAADDADISVIGLGVSYTF